MTHDTSTAAVTYEVRNSVAWLTINRPDARNSLNRAVREGLFAGVRRFNDDESAKVLVLTGSGDKAFCAGGDLKEMSQEQLTVPPVDFVPQFGRNIEVDKPTIAAVNGAAFAGGFLLAQTCDLCIASSTATFAISEVKIGRGSPWAAPLPLMVPPRIAMEIVLTGAALTAQRAYEIGFVNQVVEPDELTEATQRFAELIAANAPLSVSAGKKTARLTAEHPLSGAFEMAEKIWEPVYLSDDAQEGMLAFSEKRRPHWKGH
ncbi:enoyl-CoA hydratase/isomerase family protein [Rhodococcus opacus]|uniref:enoyl-CoA hydratase/isomerase family protein n=1 Tax=Rhodococcus TaxID=1827 RepID=UPI0013203D62|nr:MULTISPECIES: enoyl-CoA hydratase-related protein [Rhodococcus]MDJ0420104.1 enoyl-CoA hydratase-related protein [Rhodococcus opacus]MDV7089055.1 enoyl-CoA hydratase-related protein [Rhodococcus opacus]QHE73584.1 Enoyl-CoA hydratase [Rhodococcus sp. WAY2]QTJ70121.1 enoyl-CoA hydratase/isomerase family protein [Rhodococcus sp. ZPP]UNN04630.1 enoyl-CoA hydratase-related protein [Rhodococcus opacus]